MRFREAERALDVLHSDRERAKFLEKLVPRMRGNDARAALIALANCYMRLGLVKKAEKWYAQLGIGEYWKAGR